VLGQIHPHVHNVPVRHYRHQKQKTTKTQNGVQKQTKTMHELSQILQKAKTNKQINKEKEKGQCTVGTELE